MDLGWHQWVWRQAASAAQRGYAATRPGIDELRDWLNTGWNCQADQTADTEPGELDPHDPLLPSQPTPPARTTGRAGSDTCREGSPR